MQKLYIYINVTVSYLSNLQEKKEEEKEKNMEH